MISSKQFIQGELLPTHAVGHVEEDQSGVIGRTRSGRDINDYEWGPGVPHGYYNQRGRSTQLVLPGMEMTPEEHVRALGEKHGVHAELTDAGVYHVIDLKDAGTLAWNTSGMPKPGEIGMVAVHPSRRRTGLASDMLATAERIAKEHPDSATLPRHSPRRSESGIAWSRKMMRERGEEVW